MEIKISVPDDLPIERVQSIVQEVEQRLRDEAMRQSQSCYDLALSLGVIGCAEDLPTDLSTNPSYFERFGDYT